MGNLDKAVSDLEILRKRLAVQIEEQKVELERVVKELKKANVELAELEAKKEKIKSVLDKKEKELLDKVTLKEKEATERLSEANAKNIKTDEALDTAKKNLKDSEKVKVEAVAKLNSANEIEKDNTRIREKLKNTIRLIQESL